MRILRQMITDAVKDHTIVAYSKDVNDPIYQDARWTRSSKRSDP
jgi:hypothetical protein